MNQTVQARSGASCSEQRHPTKIVGSGAAPGNRMERILTGLRPYVQEDIEKLSALLGEARAWPPAAPPSAADILSRWERWHVDLERDINVLPGRNGELIAFSRASLVTDPTLRVGMEIAVHPEWRRQGIGSALYRLVEERAVELRSPHITTPVFLASGASAPRTTRFLERRGFFPDRCYWQMRLDDLAEQPRPNWPAGISYRTFGTTAEDAERWASLIRETFHEPATAARVEAQIAEPGSTTEGYLFAVDEKTGKEIGTSRARIDFIGGKQVGYLGTVGVLPEYRGRGIGQALILQTLAYLAGRGLDAAVLFVEAGNHNARRLYEYMGWTPVYQTIHYWKQLPREAANSDS